jgi:tRNA(fMet)-specific endonuclease VapC
VINRARQPHERIQAFFWLQQTLHFYCRMPILQFDQRAADHFQQLVAQKLRIGTQDLLIAAIVIANNATLLTRNTRDFQRMPGLLYKDWSIPLN